MDTVSSPLNPTVRSTLCCGLSLAALCALIYLVNPPLITLLNNKVMDAIVLHRKSGPATTNVIVVDIDEATLERFGQWPWPRYRLARLMEGVLRRGASGIALDIVMAEPDRTSLKTLQKTLEEEYGHRLETRQLPDALLDNDAVMSDALSHGPFVLGYEFLFDTPGNGKGSCKLHPVHLMRFTQHTTRPAGSRFHQATGVVCNLKTFSEAVSYSGFLNGLPDADGVLRRLPLVIGYGKDYYPSLALATLLQAEGQAKLSFRQTGLDSYQLEYGSKIIPVDRHGYLHVQFPGGESALRHVSALDLLSGGERQEDWRGSLVFIGLSASGLNAEYTIPSGDRLAEVEIQASVAAAIASSRYIHRNLKVLFVEVMISILLAAVYSLFIARYEMAPAAILGSLGILGLWQGANLIFASERLLFSPLLAAAVIIACGVFLPLFKYWSRQRIAHERIKDAILLMKGSEKRLNAIIQTIPDIVFRLDASGRIIFISPAIVKYAQKPDDLMGRHILDIVAPADRDAAAYRINERRTGSRATADMEMRLLLSPSAEGAADEGRYFSVSAEGIYSKETPDGPSFEGTQGIARDISRRKQLEHQLEQSKKMEAIGSLAAGVAHDLNNILSGLVSYPELLLLDIPEDSSMRKMIETIQRSGQRAATIVQDMLTIARQGVSNAEILNLNSAIADYLKSPEYRNIRNAHPGISVVENLSQDIMNVKGSRVHILKVLMNLVNNAVEAMPGGGRIGLSTGNIYLDTVLDAYEEIPEGEYVRLSVVDEGVGIARDDLSRVFEPFYTKKKMGQSGSGLGMTVIWTTVKDHGGYVDIYSREGDGTRFDIYFPATREVPTEERRHVVLEDYLGTERILVVDDVPEQREIAARMLGKLGYQVISMPSGEKALEYLQNHTVDLLVLDMVMQPGIDGLETYRRICEVRPHQKAIIASGFSESARVKSLQSMGAGAYIRKPYTLEKIGTAVRNELDRTM